MDSHPIFEEFTAYSGPKNNDQWVDWIGFRTSIHWVGGAPSPAMEQAWPMFPPVDEEFFEWIDLLEAVVASRDSFTMLELGAGFGRWGIRGALAAKQRGISKINIDFVEAEPQHAAWIKEAIALNELGDVNTRVFEAAISYAGEPVPFAVSAPDLDAQSWYGQCVVRGDYEKAQTDRTYFGHPVVNAYNTDMIYIEPITFEAITDQFDYIDFVDMDVQGAEQELIEKAIDVFCDKVRLVHIGTHSVEIEDAIRPIFRERGWIPRWDFSLQGTRDTPYGPALFGDGVQSWLNPRFEGDR